MKHDDETSPIELTQKRQPAAAFGYRAGEVIEGKYELVKLLERGRVTALWVVQDLVLDAQFALEMLANDGSDPQAVDHMLRQARAAAAAEHPAVIRISDFGVTHRGDPFIVMELLRGETLRQLLRAHRRFAPHEAVRLLLPIAAALELIHSRGVVHRNIKPENIVCVPGPSGRVQPKLTNFGIAGSAPVGSPEYLSPEQIQDDLTIDPRGDIWSFSAVLYEMLTGSSPFHRDTPPMTVRAIASDPVLPLARAGVFDEELSAMVLSGLQRSRGDRWQDMHAYASALAGWLVRQGVEDDATGQSLRAVWLGGTPSAPPVAMDQNPENQHFPGANDAYKVPKNRVWRTTAGIAGALVTLAAIFTAGALAIGSFGRGAAPTAALADDPWVSSEQAPETPTLSIDALPADLEPTGPNDAGDDAGAPDAAPAAVAAVEAVEAGAPRQKPLVRRHVGVNPPRAWRDPPGDKSTTLLPTPTPPPDLGPSVPPAVEEEDTVSDQPYGDPTGDLE